MANSVLIDSAYSHIRNRIRAGELMPGTLLSENELAEELNMSRTPIRAAIARLEYEGLLVTLKNRGVLVREVSLKEVMDTMELLYIFQMQAVAQIEELGEQPDLKKLKEHLDRQLEAERENVYGRYLESSMEFVSCFIGILNNMTISRIVDISVEKLALYGTVNYIRTPHEPHYSANAQHRAIYEMLLEKDYDGIRKLTSHAYQRNRERLLRSARI
ncbi:GntR family transcriptional regulator [Cohnella xylanilytica]|uniref:GntR family transcriptional regulator n=1 Tax=Cohnella xylanilytica TaxID=557555 RepID=UPI001B1A34FF|nr:GntR family transcriptional regulator [Cohnella xylanilytica]GIO16533.1 GntR family transcriptional regulator [Cohnella xylanilytica]